MQAQNIIQEGKAILGIEFGSTRIKAILIDGDNRTIAQGAHEWENQLVDGLWSYSIDAIHTGMQDCYADLCRDVKEKYGVAIERLAGIGISAMMHGYMPFDGEGKLLVPFRTWRNTNTGRAAKELSDLFVFNIPLRWSISHLYQAILDKEPHVSDVRFLTTLSGYIHWLLTGKKVLGVGDASGMLPIDSTTCNYSEGMVSMFDCILKNHGLPYT
ncbi:MAG: ATPase, partial [Muribaculaceae bacterium]|nr:ATPase [Muribaculaceae bacterium]